MCKVKVLILCFLTQKTNIYELYTLFWILPIQVVESFQKALEYSEKSFNAGYSTIFDYTLSKNNLFIAQSKLIQSKYSLLFKQKILEFYGEWNKKLID